MKYCWYSGAARRSSIENGNQLSLYNGYFYSTLENLKKLKHLSLRGLCDNQTLAAVGQACGTLSYFDISESKLVTDVGIQNLVFPAAIQKVGKINLTNTRARTNAVSKFLQVNSLSELCKERFILRHSGH